MNLLLGGLITLAVTALVQILIIPWVQRRNRRLERWEDDLIELANLLREEIPPAYWKASKSVYHFYGVRCQEPSEQREGELSRTLEAAEHDEEQVWSHALRASLLGRRVRLIRRKSPYWDQLSKAISKMTSKLAACLLRSHKIDSGNMTDVLLKNELEYGAAMRQARDLLDVIAIPMKPPPGRAARWAASVTRRSRPTTMSS